VKLWVLVELGRAKRKESTRSRRGVWLGPPSSAPLGAREKVLRSLIWVTVKGRHNANKVLFPDFQRSRAHIAMLRLLASRTAPRRLFSTQELRISLRAASSSAEVESLILAALDQDIAHLSSSEGFEALLRSHSQSLEAANRLTSLSQAKAFS
jgi:hypothetical protein